MNANSNIWIIGLLSLCLSACGDHSSPAGDEPSVSVPIGFSSDVPPQEKEQTRATTDAISSMYVFASYTQAANWKTTDVPNFMYKQLMEKSSGSWTYSPLKYWPKATDEKISFFAYAPADITNLTPSAANASGPKLTYTIPQKIADHQDLLVGSCLNRKKGSGTVSFTMKHALTQVKFKIKKDVSEKATVNLTALNILAPGKATLSFTTIEGNFAWTLDNTATSSTFTAAIPPSVALTDAATEFGPFFLFPVGDPSLQVTLKLTYTLTNASGSNTGTSVPITSAIALPATPVWNSGSSIIYTTSVMDDRLEINSVTVTDFGNGTEAGTDIPAT